MPDVSGSTLAVPVNLADAGPYISGISDQIIGELNHLASLLAPLADTWTGTAHAYYDGLQQEWNMAAEGLFGDAGNAGVLGLIAHALRVNWHNYTDCEWANTKTWQH
jgi:hypothetical protein